MAYFTLRPPKNMAMSADAMKQSVAQHDGIIPLGCAWDRATNCNVMPVLAETSAIEAFGNAEYAKGHQWRIFIWPESQAQTTDGRQPSNGFISNAPKVK